MNGLRRNDDAMKIYCWYYSVNNKIQEVAAALFTVRCTLFTNLYAPQAM